MINIFIFAILMTASCWAKQFISHPNENQKIVGGEDAEQGQFPYQVSIYFYGDMSVDLNPQNICGGSIYSETVIVTAAHCCKIFEDTGYNTTWFEIIAGELIFSQNSGLEQRSKIYTYLIHPDYSNHGANDICLLYLETELDFSGDDVYYIEAALSDPEPGTLCDISGWGPLEYGESSIPDHLQWANVTIYSNEICPEHYSDFLPDVMLCAGGNGKGCQGDIGGPLVCGNELVGITSFATGCGDLPWIFTRVSAFYEWIWDNEDIITSPKPPTTIKSTEPPTDCSICYEDILKAVSDCMNAGDIGWLQCVQDILGAGNPCIECICQIIDDICGIFGCDLNCHDPTTNTIHVQF